jgi:chromate transporter
MILRLFLYNLLAGALSFGGGYAMITILQHQYVTTLHLLSNSEFLDAIAVGQVSPGPLMIFVAFIGYRLAGFPGALVSVVGLFLPSFVAAVLLSIFFKRYQESAWSKNIASYAGYAAIGLLVGLLGLLIYQNFAWPMMVIAAISFLLLYFTRLEPLPVIALAALLGLLFKALPGR